MKTTFTLTAKQARTIELIGLMVIVSLVLFALLTGDLSRFNSTYLSY